jgi:hypothetical protein
MKSNNLLFNVAIRTHKSLFQNILWSNIEQCIVVSIFFLMICTALNICGFVLSTYSHTIISVLGLYFMGLCVRKFNFSTLLVVFFLFFSSLIILLSCFLRQVLPQFMTLVNLAYINMFLLLGQQICYKCNDYTLINLLRILQKFLSFIYCYYIIGMCLFSPVYTLRQNISQYLSQLFASGLHFNPTVLGIDIAIFSLLLAILFTVYQSAVDGKN